MKFPIKVLSILILFAFMGWGTALPAQAVFLQTKQAASESLMQQVSVADKSNPMQAFTLKHAEAKKVEEALQSILGEGEKVGVNEKLNVIVVRASQENIKRAAKVIEEMDQPPLQVMVEARIIEVKNNNGDTNNSSVLGLNWRYQQNSNDYVQQLTTTTLTTGATALGLYAQLISGNVGAYLNALEKTVGYDLVASPWVTALNHHEAEILIGSKYGYKTSIISQTSTVQQIQFLEVGTKLKFTPHISGDGFIVMDLYPSISEGSVQNELPQENTTETKNKVLVRDGQTIVIGGLTKAYHTQTNYGIPFLMDIPFLGAPFRRTELISEKRDIIIIITPHIVTPQFLSVMEEKAKVMEAQREQAAKGKGLLH